MTSPDAFRPLDIGSRLELFVDDHLIEEVSGLTQDLHSPIPRESAIVVDRPWESPHLAYATVFPDGDRFRMYYRAIDASKVDPQPSGTGYAESRDGVTWEKPDLGIIDYRGSKKNNLVWNKGQSVNFSGGFNLCPFKDESPGSSPDHRYKALINWAGVKGSPLFAVASPDGLNWDTMQSGPAITGWPPSEMQNYSTWDSRIDRYVAFVRLWRHGGHTKGVRSTVRTLSEDYLHWSDPEWLDFGDAPQEHLYTFAPVQYHRAPHIYLAFSKRFMPPPDGVGGPAEGIQLVPGRKWAGCASRDTWLGPGAPDHGVSDGVFACSRDGLHWKRYVEAFIRPGRDGQNWTDRNFLIASGVLQTAHDELSVYYVEHYNHPTARVRRGSLRLDGFVSLRAKYPEGRLVTRPLLFSGSEMVLNYGTSAAGGIRVELQDEHGRAIQGYELEGCSVIYGDEIERAVSWSGGSDLRSLAGRPVRLKFAMRDADLYSIRFR